MVITLVIPTRRVFRLHHVITDKHLENCAKLILVTGWVVAYGYLVEWFLDWYSGDPAEMYQAFVARPLGPNRIVFYLSMICNVAVPQIFWWTRARRSAWILWFAALLINVGMWSERMMIIVQSLQREYLPAQWGDYAPTWVDVGILAGTMGFFLLLFLAFLRFLPFIALSEMREMAHDLVKHGRRGPAPAQDHGPEHDHG
jgi:molybdopterin-containing oxidoreductase family membrane subunit